MSPLEFQTFEKYRVLLAAGKSTVEIATELLGQPCQEVDFKQPNSPAQFCIDHLQLLELKYALYAK